MAEAAKEKKDSEKPEESSSSSNKNLIIILSVAGAVVIAAALVAILVFHSGKKHKSRSSGTEEEEIVYIEDEDHVLNGAMFTLEPFAVNLQAEDTFLLFSCTIEFFDFVLPENLEQIKPKIRDAIIQTVSSKKPEELLAPKGKEKLRLQLLAALNAAVPEDNFIVDIYFLDFTIQ